MAMKGAILIYSCEKHRRTRLVEFKLSKKEYNGWHVFTVFGNPFLDREFSINDNTITVKCEDSYLFVLKKVVMGMRAILSSFPIEEGILRCGDDLVFNEEQLQRFLDGQKQDYMGVTWGRNPLATPLGKYRDDFIWNYYKHHLEDFGNPTHGLPSIARVHRMNEVPKVVAASGVIIYFSKYVCERLVAHMESMKWDIFHYSDEYGYPYIIEDISIGFILHKAGIYPTEYRLYTDSPTVFSQGNTVALHTNKYK